MLLAKCIAASALAVLLITPVARAQSASAAVRPAKTKDTAERISRIEHSAAIVPQAEGKPPIALSLSDLMEKFKVPALSIAVIDNFQIVWAKGYGVVAPDSKSPVTTKTLFQAGSISKPVAATAALHMVEQGKLALDETTANSKAGKFPIMSSRKRKR
jgi:CubicO group peptidase (beta-lactamase class C family)